MRSYPLEKINEVSLMLHMSTDNWVKRRVWERDHEVTSSSAKRTPPTGARKAAATPAAAPQVIKSRRSLSFLKYLSHFHVKWYLRDPPCPSKEAMQAPVWTMGPSLPTTNPADTPRMEPKICKFGLLDRNE